MEKFQEKMIFDMKTNPRYWCEYCHHRFDTKKECRRHVRESHEAADWELQCHWCDNGYLFSTNSNAHRHMRNVHADEYYQVYGEEEQIEEYSSTSSVCNVL